MVPCTFGDPVNNFKNSMFVVSNWQMCFNLYFVTLVKSLFILNFVAFIEYIQESINGLLVYLIKKSVELRT